MSVRNLEKLFAPKSVAVIGATPRAGAVGSVVMRNLLAAGFGGPIMPVNPKHRSIAGVLAYPDVEALPIAPDLAVICTPAPVVPDLIARLGARGTKAAIVLTAGLSRGRHPSGVTLTQAMLDAARPHSLRVLGPNCLGLLVPGNGLNASFAHVGAPTGDIAFVSQSGALCTAVLDWALPDGIGFSHFISLGDGADVDFGDTLDYLGGDPSVRAILLYVEAVSDARKFMSAARAASRNKPVICIKAGRAAEGASAAASHTGALAGADDVYDAAIRRAGMLRVFEIDELFAAVETLARIRTWPGDRLAILTNGGGPGVISTDELILGGGRLARLDDATLARLDGALPAGWSHGNPVDIVGDAPPERYAAALEILLEDPGTDAILVMHVPTAISSSADSARAVAEKARGSRKHVLTSWLGRASTGPARRAFGEAGLATYETPDLAVRAFLHIARYRANQDLLIQTPPSMPEGFEPDVEAARAIVRGALDDGRSMLSEPEAKAVLEAYRIPVVPARIARDVEEAVALADSLGYPIAVKIHSRDITHKSDVGGVALDLADAGAVRAAAEAMLARVAELRPEAKLDGFTVQPMARRPGAHELICGVATDPVFGPILLFGQGGVSVEVVADRAIALPPLNATLADDLVSRTRVAKLLAGYRDRPAADMDAIRHSLIKLSQLVVDLPEIVELDINPLLADERGVLALDARVGVAPADGPARARLAIRPYPRELEEIMVVGRDEAVLLRPIRPEDEPAHRAFHDSLSEQDIRFRFFGLVKNLPHSEMARFTQIDYDRQMAFIAVPPGSAPGWGGCLLPPAGTRPIEATGTLGVVRTFTDPDNLRAEFAIVVRSDMKGRGIGRALMEKIVNYTRERGTKELVGEVLAENRAMLGLARRFGFEQVGRARDGVVDVRLTF